MKDKIIAALKLKYGGQVTTKLIEQLAEGLAGRVEQESDIDKVLSELDTMPLSPVAMQAEVERRVTEAHQKWQAEQQPKPIAPPAPKPNGDTPADVLEEIRQQLNELRTFRQDVTKKELLGELRSWAADHKIPVSLVEGTQVETTEQLTQVKERVSKQFDEIKQTLNIQDIPDKGPVTGTKTPPKEQIASEIAEISKKLK